MSNLKTQWIPRDEGEALKRGDGCPMCSSLRDADVFQPGYANEYGRTIAHLGASLLRLGRDQLTTGYCVLIGTNHGPEPDDLDAIATKLNTRPRKCLGFHTPEEAVALTS